MPISYNEIPNNIKSPGVYIEIDNSSSNTASVDYNALLIGKIPVVKTALHGIVHEIASTKQAKDIFGNCELVEMIEIFYENVPIFNLFVMGIDNAKLSTPATSLNKLLERLNKQYWFIGLGLNDLTSITYIAKYLGDGFSALKQTSGIAFCAIEDNFANFNNNYNHHLISITALKKIQCNHR